jgi:hypothetical protein
MEGEEREEREEEREEERAHPPPLMDKNDSLTSDVGNFMESVRKIQVCTLNFNTLSSAPHYKQRGREESIHSE